MEVLSIGIDQGLANLGYAILTFSLDENYNEQGIKLLESGTFTTSPKYKLQERLLKIHDIINDLNLKYNANVIGCEKLFFNPVQKFNLRNKSASIMLTNMVSGVIFLVAGENNLYAKDFTPGTVKKYVSGNGRAKKEEVIKAVEDFCLKEGAILTTDHQSDAIAIGITTGRYYINNIIPIEIAENAVKTAETSKEQEDMDKALELVNKLITGTEKITLLKRINKLIKQITKSKKRGRKNIK